MNKHVPLILSAICLIMALSGCSQPGVKEVSLGTEFTLSPGQSAAVAGENLSIKFVEVVSDSRCPRGVTCIRAGEASCLIEVTDSQSTYSKALTQPGLTTPPTASLANYEIAFDIQPYPEAGIQTDKKDYRLQLVVSKRSALSSGIPATAPITGGSQSGLPG